MHDDEPGPGRRVPRPGPRAALGPVLTVPPPDLPVPEQPTPAPASAPFPTPAPAPPVPDARRRVTAVEVGDTDELYPTEQLRHLLRAAAPAPGPRSEPGVAEPVPHDGEPELHDAEPELHDAGPELHDAGPELHDEEPDADLGPGPDAADPLPPPSPTVRRPFLLGVVVGSLLVGSLWGGAYVVGTATSATGDAGVVARVAPAAETAPAAP